MHNARTSFLTILLIIGLTSAQHNKPSDDATAKSRSHKNNNDSNTTMFPTTRNPKIMYGFPTREGEFGWQASLELLHPSLGFIGHWCGGVLIHNYWVLSSAHCIHNDLFNLPLPALWTIVLGENNRKVESGYEQRIPVDKIIMHEKYQHFKNDLVLMKLNRAADLTQNSRVRTIFLPSSAQVQVNPNNVPANSPSSNDEDLFDRNENYLRKMNANFNKLANLIAQVNQNEIKKRTAGNRTTVLRSADESGNSTKVIKSKRHRRRNDKFLHRRPTSSDDKYWMNRDEFASNSIDYFDCVAVGWGKYRNSGDLSDALLKIEVPIQNIKRCEEVYSDFVSLHQSQHLCAGNIDGRGGTCVGDSGGGLQCKLNRNGPWVLVGITSFGSGCAKAGYPDVFTNVAYYRNWIDNALRNN